MQNLKTLTLSIIIGLTFAGTVTSAAISWHGTDWIRNGQSISATYIKDNFDYLKAQAASGGALWIETLSATIKGGKDLVYSGGNVGVGVSAPGKRLDVLGEVRVQNAMYPKYHLSATSNKLDLKKWQMYVLPTTGNFRLAALNDVESAESAGFNIDRSGNIGINTTVPEAQLHIANGAFIHPGSTSLLLQGAYKWLFTAANSDMISSTNPGTHGALTIGKQGDTPAITIQNDNNVGIGTPTPSNKLEVAGNIEADAYCDRNGQNCIANLMPPTCVGVGKALQWDGASWICAIAQVPTPAPVVIDPFLYGSRHKESACKSISGTAVSIGGAKICEYTGSSCPTGWNQYAGNIKTSPNTCAGNGYPYCGYSYNYKCTTTGHSTWSTTSETCTYYNRGWRSCARGPVGTCTAKTVNVACY